MQNKQDVLPEGWLRDITRVTILTILYLAEIYLGLTNSFFYGGGFVGYFPFLLALFVGPWAAAWVACKIAASSRPLLLRLAVGSYAGFVPFLIVVYALSALTPEWKLGDPPSRVTQNEEAFSQSLSLCSAC